MKNKQSYQAPCIEYVCLFNGKEDAIMASNINELPFETGGYGDNIWE